MTRVSDEVVERVAMALHLVEDSWNDVDWEFVSEEQQAEFRKQAGAAIEASGHAELLGALRTIRGHPMCSDQIGCIADAFLAKYGD